MKIWHCEKQCGACCHLDPADRPDLGDYLSAEELDRYMSMVGEDGWCINFDRQTRECSIYEQRPRFCRVQSDIFAEMYDVSSQDFNDFAIDCCRQQITGVYGDLSPEMSRYNESH
ncbi:YkgJ family cysteine cluster protein [Spirulina sp. 06S082]|uniref:YkgJ family cysteine cluster protein n=1 Tax=Spirulina sp. 06S082 TaxID=3110248 RepID=UPI002B20FC3F|nr:YkgJ family cysteine cluster protein [Spirulina sp. 06S082]MEA5470578.1 YkgJ family cysteine cluster protein [Spirulina sp. 06S082]